MRQSKDTQPNRRRWLYPVVYLLLIVVNFLPLYAQKPYAPQETQEVIISLLMVATQPYRLLGSLLHVATALLAVLVVFFAERVGRPLAAFMGLNYLVIAGVQGMGTTERYGFVIHTGALVTSALLGIAWLIVAFRGTLRPSYKGVPALRYFLLPLAVLAFWGPYNSEVQPYFNPLLLVTSPDSGLTFCFTTPVFLFLLILFYPRVDGFAYRITAFSGLLYGLFNMTHFFNPELRWMGVMHLPLLVISLVALTLPAIEARRAARQAV